MLNAWTSNWNQISCYKLKYINKHILYIYIEYMYLFIGFYNKQIDLDELFSSVKITFIKNLKRKLI